MMRRSRTRSPFIARALFVAAVVAMVFASTALIRETQRRQAIAREIRTIADEVDRLDERRERLTDLLQHADSPEFLEREARLQLELQKPGESVYIIRELAGARVPDASPNTPPEAGKRWWKYFFD